MPAQWLPEGGVCIRELSMSPGASTLVRQRIRAIASRDARVRATDALRRKDAEGIRALVYS